MVPVGATTALIKLVTALYEQLGMQSWCKLPISFHAIYVPAPFFHYLFICCQKKSFLVFGGLSMTAKKKIHFRCSAEAKAASRLKHQTLSLSGRLYCSKKKKLEQMVANQT